MQQVIKSLLALAILAHASLGCCAHHSHAAGASCCPTESLEHAHHRKCPQACQHAEEPIPQPAAPTECDHRNCLWTAGEFSVLPSLLLDSTWLNALEAAGDLAGCCLPATFTSEAAASVRLCPAPPVRTHLALNVQLI
ncbi:hypothetical protein [Adhaeretor mobilis]|uniref:hypothetical protein n=1 Tax=Adhaeretor mobilis TaxID=1930276 RepID=UPI00119E1F42|nr:hypothetical protein [Adhaeretor mobilis]